MRKNEKMMNIRTTRNGMWSTPSAAKGNRQSASPTAGCGTSFQPMSTTPQASAAASACEKR
jgi:hypothetical protein